MKTIPQPVNHTILKIKKKIDEKGVAKIFECFIIFLCYINSIILPFNGQMKKEELDRI